MRNTWDKLVTTFVSTNTAKTGVDMFSGLLSGIDTVISALDKVHMVLPTAIASFALLKTTISSFKGAETMTAGFKALGESITGIGTKAKGAWTALQALTGLSSLGLVGAFAGVAAAAGLAYVAIKKINEANQAASKRYDELTKSVNEHKKALSEAEQNESNLTSLYNQYEKLSDVTNKTKEQQEQYNDVLKQLEKIDPDLVIYDENGSPIKTRKEEVEELIEEYKQAQQEQKKLLAGDIKEKAKTSYDKYNSGDDKSNREKLKTQAKAMKSQNLEQYVAKLQLGTSTEWFKKLLGGDSEMKATMDNYFTYLQKVQDKEKEAIDTITKQRQSVNKDQSSYLDNFFGSDDDLQKAQESSKAMKSAIDNLKGLDFSELDFDSVEKLGSSMSDWLLNAGDKGSKSFNDLISQANEASKAWESGSSTAATYEKSIDGIAKKMSELTNGAITEEQAKKMLTIPEFDATQEARVFSDLDNAKNTLQKKLTEIANVESPRQRIQMAYDIVQDDTMPQKVREKVAELAKDGTISDQDLEVIMNLVGDIDDKDLEQKTNKKLDELSKKKKITKEIAIEYAGEVKNSTDFDKYLREITGDKSVARHIQVDIGTGDVEALKNELDALPDEKKIGITMAAVNSGEYTPDQIVNLIDSLPQTVQTQILPLLDDTKYKEVVDKIGEATEDKEVKIKIKVDDDQKTAVASTLDKLKVDQDVQVKIKTALNNGDLQGVIDAVNKLPNDKQVDIYTSVITNGSYTPDEIKEIINNLPEDKQIQVTAETLATGEYKPDEFKQILENFPESKQIEIIANILKSGDMTPEQLANEIKGLPDDKQINIITSLIENGNINITQLPDLISNLPSGKQIEIVQSVVNEGNYTPSQLNDMLNSLPKEVSSQISVNLQDNATGKINGIEGRKLTDKNVNINATDKATSKVNQVDKFKQFMEKIVTISAKDQASSVIKNLNLSPVTKMINIGVNFLGDAYKWLTGKGGSSGGSGGTSKQSLDNNQRPVNIDQPVDTGIATYSNDQPMAVNAGDEGVATQASSRAIDSVSTTPTRSTKISTSLSNVWKSVKYGIDLFQELEYRIKKVENNIGLLDAKMSRAVGTNRIKLLEQQNKLYKQQAGLTKTLYNTQTKAQKQLAKKVKSYGFGINADGNVTNYEEQLRKLEDAAEAAEKKLKAYQEKVSNSSKKSSKTTTTTTKTTKNKNGSTTTKKTSGNSNSTTTKKTTKDKNGNKTTTTTTKKTSSSSSSSKTDKVQKALEKASDAAKDKLDNAQKALTEYLNLSETEIPKTKEEWVELNNKIKENADEIEKLKFEDKIYKQKNAIDKLNNSLKEQQSYEQKASTLAERYNGTKKTKYLKEQNTAIQKQIDLNKQLQKQTNSELKAYQSKLKEYGAKFDKNGNISNYDSLLNKYQNSDKLEKVKEWAEGYVDLKDSVRDVENEIESLKNKQIELNNEIKIAEFDAKFVSLDNSIGKCNQTITKLNNEVDILSVKLQNAIGVEKIDLLNQEIEKWKELQKQQEKSLDSMKRELSLNQEELRNYGFTFDNDGNMTNKDSKLNSYKDKDNYDYVSHLVEKWEQLYNTDIPNATKEVENYKNSVKDAYNTQLDTIKTVEDKIKEMYKQQIEDRKKAIQDGADAEIKAINKVKEAYQKNKDTNDYEEKLKEQQEKIADINKQIELARKDNSLSGQSKLADLMDQLKDEQKNLQDIVNDRQDSLINDMFDQQTDAIQEKSDKAVEELEKTWTDSKIYDMIDKALGTGQFTSINGEVSNLQDAMLKFAETSGDALGLTADKIKTDLVGSLQEAVDYANNLDGIMSELGATKFDTTPSTQSTTNKNTSITVGDIKVTVDGETTDPKELAKQISAQIKTELTNITNRI